MDGHKGTYGHLYAVCGSRGFTGAAKMVGNAAMRSGAGLVTVGVPASLGDLVGAGLMEVMTMLLPATDAETISADAVDPALAFAEDKDAVALGPGLSQHSGAQAFVREFVQRCPVPMVIDADGLNALAGHTAILDRIEQPVLHALAELGDSPFVFFERESHVVALSHTGSCPEKNAVMSSNCLMQPSPRLRR